MIAIEEMFAHSGHNSDRPCGHSSLIRAVDAEIAVKRDPSETMSPRSSLSKDGEAGAEIVSPLVPVEVGGDHNGEPIKVLLPAGRPGTSSSCASFVRLSATRIAEMPTFVDEPVLGCGA